MSDAPKPPSGRDAELEAELRSHLEMAARDRVARGESPTDAVFAARRELGNRAHIVESTREAWGGMWLERLAQDTKYAVRSLSRVPGFAFVAILTLALGIGANSAIFSVVNGVLLRPLPYPHPDRLLYITSQFPKLGFDQFPLDATEFMELRERATSFENIGGYTTNSVNVGTTTQPQRVVAALTTASLIPTLGVKPLLGRVYTEAETLPNATDVGVLSYELWQSSFGGQASIIGRRIDIDGVPTTIVGVMPPRFDVHDQHAKLWLPLTIDPARRQQNRGGHFLFLVGRLKSDVSAARARVELQSLLARWQEVSTGVVSTGPVTATGNQVHTPNSLNHRLRYDDLRADMIGTIGTALWVLQAATFLVLLIACANMANLLLMRAESRHKELALRVALGAGRGRLIRQFIAESLVLSVTGAVAGLAIAKLGLVALVSNNDSIPRAESIGLDPQVLLFTLALALLTGIVFGLAPLLHLRASGIGLALRDASSRTTQGTARTRVRGALVVTEMALAVMLVVGAGLLLRSFWNLLRVDTGFDRQNIVSFNVSLPQRTYPDSTRAVAFFETLSQRLRAVPGVSGAAAMSGLPPLRSVNANDTQFENFQVKEGGPAQNVDYWQFVTPTYLETMRIPIVAGRAFRVTDDGSAPHVVMINEALARLFYPGQDAIGKRLRPPFVKEWATIVGVVKDVKQGGVESKTGTELYFPYAQAPGYLGSAPRAMNVVLRTTLPITSVSTQIRQSVAALDPSLPVNQLRTMDEVFGDAVSRPHFLAQLLGIFAGVALALAAIGTYGVLAYNVTERRREIGIRMALGADASGVLAMVLAQGMRLTAYGLVVGLIGAFAANRLAASLLFGVKPTDPLTFGGVAMFILIVAAIACTVPARRATRVDPLVALRSD